jgi:hypothetical protein
MAEFVGDDQVPKVDGIKLTAEHADSDRNVSLARLRFMRVVHPDYLTSPCRSITPRASVAVPACASTIGSMTGRHASTERKRPRTFVPPPVRRPKPRRAPLGWPYPGWRERIVPSVARAFCAVAFAGFAAFETRFGDSALVIASVGLAAFISAIVYVSAKMQSEFSLGVLLPDVVALLLLPSALWIASGIKVADERFGGNAGHFLLAALAVLGLTGVIMILAAVASVRAPERSVLGAMSGSLAAIAVLAGGSRFASGSLPDGLSVAWMVTAAITLSDGIVSPRSRHVLRFAVVVGFALVVFIVGVTASSSADNTTNDVIATIAAGGICAAVLMLPGWTARLSTEVVETPDSAQTDPTRGAIFRLPGGRRQI